MNNTFRNYLPRKKNFRNKTFRCVKCLKLLNVLEIKPLEIKLTHTVTHPRAMMVELRYTAVAHTTVFGPHWFPYLLTGM